METEFDITNALKGQGDIQGHVAFYIISYSYGPSKSLDMK